MSFNLEFIDANSLSIIQNSISEICDVSFQAYDSSGYPLAPLDREDELLAQINSRKSSRNEHENFICNCTETTALRNEPSLFKGHFNQHQFFIPISINSARIMLVSSPFYLAKSEFKDFLDEKGQFFGFSKSDLSLWESKIRVFDSRTVEKIGSNIKILFEILLKSSYEKSVSRKKYMAVQRIIDFFSHIKQPANMEQIFATVLNILLFEFNIETASIMIREDNIYRTITASGWLKGDVIPLRLKEDNPLIQKSAQGYRTASSNDIAELSGFGFPDSINAVHIFPILDDNYPFGLIMIYNAVISRDTVYTLLEICKLVGAITKNLNLQKAYDRCISDAMSLNYSKEKLSLGLNNPDELYDTIVDSATELLNAEKGSIMLFEQDSLVIKAVKGISKWLLQDSRIEISQSIAGKVFTEGMPLLVENTEEMQLPYFKERKHYKTHSFISMPVKFVSEIIGVLNVSDKITLENFTERDLNLLSNFISYISIILKAADYHAMAEQMKELSVTDPLTGLFNRRYLQDRFSEEIHRSERHDLIFSIAMFDIDDFKLFNDKEGHLAGDDVLKKVASTAHGCLRANDILSRFGGEEFLVIMPQTNKDEALAVAERIRTTIKESVRDRWEKFPKPYITVSAGISSYPEDGKDINELIKSVDTALYKAKASGKNTTVVFQGIE